jgi:TPP-dependent pyruvate/acetoin dehydrogenase alpha subunit
MQVDVRTLEQLHRDMWRIRLVEEEIAERYAQQEMRCPVHLSIGQEAAAVGVARALRTDDTVFTTHRCHAHYLAKGGDLRRMLAEIYGRSTGCVGGRGGSMHLCDASVGLVASVPIVGSAIPLAVGAALKHAIDGDGRIGVALFGDAAVEEGVFHESANFAKLRDLPVLFVCENNLYSVYTPLASRQPPRPLTALADAHRIPFAHVDGNDVVAVYEAACESVAAVRAGSGPRFLQLDTYRHREHCGPAYDNHLGYRTEAEFEHWRALCPLARSRRRLDSMASYSDVDEKNLIEVIRAEIEEAFAFARASAAPDPDTASLFVYPDAR